MDERPAASIKVVGCGGGGGNALNRMVDTGVGVLMSMLINYLFPRERLVRWIAWWKKRANAMVPGFTPTHDRPD